MTEKAWQAQVIELARFGHWHHFHAYEMRRSTAGWPDLTLVRMHGQWAEMIFAELKTDTGRLSPAQLEWGELLGAVARAAPNIDYYVWRPRDFEHVRVRLLSGQR